MIASRVPDVRAMHEQAESEQQLLCVYHDMLPDVSSEEWQRCRGPAVGEPAEAQVCVAATEVHPSVCSRRRKLFVRAVSLALFGRESAHCQLWLLAAIEVLTLSGFLWHDERTVPPYRADSGATVKDIARDDTYSDTLTVLAVSSVAQKPIQTWWPVTVNPGEASPFMKLVNGRAFQFGQKVSIWFSLLNRFFFDSIPQSDKFVACTLIFK